MCSNVRVCMYVNELNRNTKWAMHTPWYIVIGLVEWTRKKWFKLKKDEQGKSLRAATIVVTFITAAVAAFATAIIQMIFSRCSFFITKNRRTCFFSLSLSFFVLQGRAYSDWNTHFRILRIVSLPYGKWIESGTERNISHYTEAHTQRNV